MPNALAASEAIIRAAPRGWMAVHLGLITAAHAQCNGWSDLVSLARLALKTVHQAGYRSQVDERRTRFVGSAITRWQTHLYAVNELPCWRFPDPILLVGWLLECGGPAMSRGPARAAFEKNGVDLMIGGTRWRYNHQRYGHGGEGLPTSREYPVSDCVLIAAPTRIRS